ncbi:MAG: ABC transporter permease, partial [Actinomycetota bacterium]|nr:ABC transporter permease [Actinomycetota bacterium]
MKLSEWFATRVGGVLVPLGAAVLAFLVGGVVVAATGHNPLGTYKAIFEGTGLNWPFLWITGQETRAAWSDLQQTLIITTPLMLTALAVAFAFRCGMFNIGGNGQYIVGLVCALYVGSQLGGAPRVLHVALAMLAALLGGAIWGGIAGLLRATVGAHEVISTIMLNFVALFVGKYLFELGGPLQGDEPSIPRSGDIADSAKLWEIGTGLQPLHAGIFVALAGLVVYHLLLNRTTVGYEVRAVGFNPEAARYGGISVGRNYFLALAISGGFAGLAASVDLLGWKFRIATNDLDNISIGFIGIAVALLGRNKAVGILFSALLFGALAVGTSPRQLDPQVFPAELAGNLAVMIQALIIFFVGAELIIVSLWGLRRRAGFAGPTRVQPELLK